MTEFIITSDQLERLIEGIEHDTGREISRVVAHGTELPEVVRCRDCKYFASDELGDYCTLLDFEDVRSMDNCFCAWATRRADA